MVSWINHTLVSKSFIILYRRTILQVTVLKFDEKCLKITLFSIRNLLKGNLFKIEIKK